MDYPEIPEFRTAFSIFMFNFEPFQNIHVCTVYTNLGDDAVVHALNETAVSIVVTSHELLPRFKKMLNNLPNITTIIYMEDQLQKTPVAGYKDGVDIKAFRQIVTTVSS